MATSASVRVARNSVNGKRRTGRTSAPVGAFRQAVREYALGWALGLLFLASWGMQFVSQVLIQGEDLASFWSATFENWQSEFLQLLTFVVLARFLIFRDSPQSRDGDDDLKEQITRIERKLDSRAARNGRR